MTIISLKSALAFLTMCVLAPCSLTSRGRRGDGPSKRYIPRTTPGPLSLVKTKFIKINVLGHAHGVARHAVPAGAARHQALLQHGTKIMMRPMAPMHFARRISVLTAPSTTILFHIPPLMNFILSTCSRPSATSTRNVRTTNTCCFQNNK